MSLFTILIFVAMLISTMNEVATKRRREQQGQGAPRRPGQRLPTGEPFPHHGGADHGEDFDGDGAPPRARIPRTTSAEESAQVLLPDDLWAILTGEQRPARVPAPVDLEPVADEELELHREPELHLEVEPEQEWSPGAESRAEDDGWGEPDSRVLPDRRSVVRPREGRSREPEIFSYDEVIPSADERHEEFHRRIDQRPDSTGRAAARGASAARLRRLRRAVVLKEVLGPPRGLEDPY